MLARSSASPPLQVVRPSGAGPGGPSRVFADTLPSEARRVASRYHDTPGVERLDPAMVGAYALALPAAARVVAVDADEEAAAGLAELLHAHGVAASWLATPPSAAEIA